MTIVSMLFIGGSAFLLGLLAGTAIAWPRNRPNYRYRFYEIQQHCAAEGHDDLAGTARVLHVLQANPDMLKSLLTMGAPVVAGD